MDECEISNQLRLYMAVKGSGAGKQRTPISNGNSMVPLHKSSTYKYENGERKIIDPVVARLKEARRLEKEKKEQETRAKKGLAPRQPKTPKATIPLRTGPSVKAKAKSTPVKTTTALPVSSRPKPTKMKFSDLMKKASTIDQTKLSINIKAKSLSPSLEAKRAGKSGESSRHTSASPKLGARPSNISSRSPGPSLAGKRIPKVVQEAAPRAPLPIRAPSAKLSQKLKGRPSRSEQHNKYHEEDEDDMDDFIASDEEEYEQDYNRDEIWAMFNKGRKRSQIQYDDYDSDDMEATGAEIFDEERKSKRRAELEDRKEMEEEQRRAEEKRRRKMASRG